MALSKKDDPVRKFRSAMMHTVFMVKPILVALLVTAGWYELWTHGIHFADKDETVLVGGVILSLSVIFAAFAGGIFPKILDKFEFLTKCVLTGDRTGFMLMRDERQPIRMNLMLGVTAVSWLFMVIMIDYHDVVFGGSAVFTLTLCLSTIFFATMELGDPANSPWFLERTPPAWFRENVDEYFRLNGAKPKPTSRRSRRRRRARK